MTEAEIRHPFTHAELNARPLRMTELRVWRGTVTNSTGAAAVGTTALLVRGDELPPALLAVTRQATCCPTSASVTT